MIVPLPYSPLLSLTFVILSNISIGGSGNCALPGPNSSPRPHARSRANDSHSVRRNCAQEELPLLRPMQTRFLPTRPGARSARGRQDLLRARETDSRLRDQRHVQRSGRPLVATLSLDDLRQPRPSGDRPGWQTDRKCRRPVSPARSGRTGETTFRTRARSKRRQHVANARRLERGQGRGRRSPGTLFQPPRGSARTRFIRGLVLGTRGAHFCGETSARARFLVASN